MFTPVNSVRKGEFSTVYYRGDTSFDPSGLALTIVLDSTYKAAYLKVDDECALRDFVDSASSSIQSMCSTVKLEVGNYVINTKCLTKELGGSPTGPHAKCSRDACRLAIANADAYNADTGKIDLAKLVTWSDGDARQSKRIIAGKVKLVRVTWSERKAENGVAKMNFVFEAVRALVVTDAASERDLQYMEDVVTPPRKRSATSSDSDGASPSKLARTDIADYAARKKVARRRAPTKLEKAGAAKGQSKISDYFTARRESGEKPGNVENVKPDSDNDGTVTE